MKNLKHLLQSIGIPWKMSNYGMYILPDNIT